MQHLSPLEWLLAFDAFAVLVGFGINLYLDGLYIRKMRYREVKLNAPRQ